MLTPVFWRRHFLLHLAAFFVLGFWVVQQTRPVILPDLNLAEGERLAGVSYAPYHKPGQTPFDPHQRIPREQIAADLKALAKITHCVRIYAVDQGLENVPELAGHYGLKVLLGAWIGRDAANNRAQIETAVRLANQYPETVRAVIVGNEVLLRREQPEAALRAMLDEMKSRVHVPVTYADVWEFWLQHPDLADSVDFATVHILPYWEDEPIAVEHAVEHVAAIRERMMQSLRKPVLIGETGWPSEGRERENARPGIVEQARFVRTFIREAHDRGWDYNLIEAIDQPWKRLSEGTVGGYWGMLDVELQPKFPLQGAVRERASALPFLLASLIGAFVCGAIGLKTGTRRWRWLTGVTAGAWAGGMLWLGYEHALVAWRNLVEWLALGVVTLAGAELVFALVAWRPRLASSLRMLVFFSAAVGALLLLADPRYRDFPLALYALPLPALLTLRGMSATIGRAEKICAALIVLCGIARWLMEPMNPQAQAWAALCVLLAGCAIISKESTAPGAA
ncbi:MAG: glucan 1,3-beta-glucosidase [Methylobacillus sp.]|jgi:glucan 1,3-beta-glucosidase|nr:glucan 1,3-beta-glucosidase [Methylobacillus sp.]